jgi:hypothetical protein
MFLYFFYYSSVERIRELGARLVHAEEVVAFTRGAAEVGVLTRDLAPELRQRALPELCLRRSRGGSLRLERHSRGGGVIVQLPRLRVARLRVGQEAAREGAKVHPPEVLELNQRNGAGALQVVVLDPPHLNSTGKQSRV